MNLSKKEHYLIMLPGILFLVLYGICSYFNRFAVDDYYHIHDEQFYGIWGGMLEGYYQWGGRWTAYLLWGCIYHFKEFPGILALYTFSLIILFTLSVYLSIQRYFSFTEIREKKNTILIYSVTLASFFFFFSFGKGEIFFWMQSTAMFFVSIIAFIFGLGFILSKSKNIFSYILIIICFSYCGGASETYAASYILLLILLYVFLHKYSKSNIPADAKKTIYIKTFIAFIFLAASFVISLNAPGNANRAAWLPEPSFTNALFITLKELGKLIIFNFIPQLYWAVLFSIPFIYYGYLKGNASEKKPLKRILKPIFFSLVLLFITMYALLFPACYILSEAGPVRSMSLIILLVVLFIIGWAYYIGKYFIKNLNLIKYLNYTSFIIVSTALISISIFQFKTLSEYSAASDKRNEMLMQLQKEKNRKTITVPPLPPSGYLYSAEISSDTNYFGNDHYRLGLFLGFKVRKE